MGTTLMDILRLTKTTKADVDTTLRQAHHSDLEQIMYVENRAWPKGSGATEEMFRARISTFPKGCVVAEVAGKIRGVVVGQILKDYDLNNPTPTWEQATDSGYLANTHDPHGNILYGVNLSVDPDFENKGIGSRLLASMGMLAVRHNLKGALLGGRLPEYRKYAHKVSVEQYLRLTTTDGEPLDAEVRFYQRAGLKIIKILPNYFKDPQSLNYAVLLYWQNPFYLQCSFLGKIIGIPLDLLLSRM